MALNICVLSQFVIDSRSVWPSILAHPEHIFFSVLLHFFVLFCFWFSTLRTIKPYLKGKFRHMHKRKRERGRKKENA